MLQGYTARSRQQSLDRRDGAAEDRKQSKKETVAKTSANEKSKPPAVPKRKKNN